MVNKSLEFIRDLWIKARLNAPPSVQRTVILRLHEAKEIVRLLARPYLPVYQLQGQGRGGPLMVTHIGLEYAKPFLKDLLFVEDPVEQKVGRIPFWRHDELANLSSGDIIVVETTRHLIRKLPRQNAIVLPQYVHHILDVRGDWQDVKSRFRKSTRRELRLTQKYDYQYEVSHDDQDFEMFYHNMYVPTMKNRHGSLASLISASEAYQYFRHGLLFLVKRDGQGICGSICDIEQDTVRYMIMGVINGDQQLMDEGAIGALNCLRIQWANQHGYKAVNFLGSGIPRLNGGMFQYKRKWGTAISVPPHLHRQIWIRIQHNTPTVSQFLKENPFIVVDENGKLHGLIVVDDPHNVSAKTRKGWEKRYVTPGLSSLLIRPVSHFTEGSANDNDAGLVIPIPPSSSSGNGQ
jgi:hypothetical protein